MLSEMLFREMESAHLPQLAYVSLAKHFFFTKNLVFPDDEEKDMLF